MCRSCREKEILPCSKLSMWNILTWHNGLDEYLQWIAFNFIFLGLQLFYRLFISNSSKWSNEENWLGSRHQRETVLSFSFFMTLQPLSQGPTGMSWIDCNAKANDGFGCERSLFISSFNPPWPPSKFTEILPCKISYKIPSFELKIKWNLATLGFNFHLWPHEIQQLK